MKINKIEISNFKAFYGTHTIDVGGKNLLIYGENGSGKSSLYYALNDFFEAVSEPYNESKFRKLADLKNVFQENNENKCSVSIDFYDDKENINKRITWNDNREEFKINKLIRFLEPISKRKTFYNSRKVVLFSDAGFDILEHIIFRFFKDNKFNDRTLISNLFFLKEFNNRSGVNTNRNKREILNTLKFQLESIIVDLNSDSSYGLNYFLKKFGLNIEIDLTIKPFDVNALNVDNFRGIITSNNKFAIEKPNRESIIDFLKSQISFKIKYFNKDIKSNSHLFLNEARRSAICLSAMFSSIKLNLNNEGFKILVFDDPLIGMDNSNRGPFTEILNKDFNEYQIFLLTHDSSWFEYAKRILKGENSWSFKEMYSTLENGIPNVHKVLESGSYRTKALHFINEKDFLSAGNSLRKEAEEILNDDRLCPLLNFTDKKGIDRIGLNDLLIKVTNVVKNILSNRVEESKLTVSEKAFVNTSIKPLKDLSNCIGHLLNPLSHYDPSFKLYSAELKKVIRTLDEVKLLLDSFTKDKFKYISLDFSIIIELKFGNHSFKWFYKSDQVLFLYTKSPFVFFDKNLSMYQVQLNSDLPKKIKLNSGITLKVIAKDLINHINNSTDYFGYVAQESDFNLGVFKIMCKHTNNISEFFPDTSGQSLF